MGVVQGLKATDGVGNDVRDIGDKVDAVLDGAHLIFFSGFSAVNEFMARWREREGRVTTSCEGRKRPSERCK